MVIKCVSRHFHLNFVYFFELVQCPITAEFCISGDWKHKLNYCTVTLSIYLLRQPNQNKRQLNKILLRLLVFIPIRYFQRCFLAHLVATLLLPKAWKSTSRPTEFKSIATRALVQCRWHIILDRHLTYEFRKCLCYKFLQLHSQDRQQFSRCNC